MNLGSVLIFLGYFLTQVEFSPSSYTLAVLLHDRISSNLKRRAGASSLLERMWAWMRISRASESLFSSISHGLKAWWGEGGVCACVCARARAVGLK